MRTGLTLFTAGLLAGAVSAQGVITRMNAGTSTFYYDGNIQTPLDDADAIPGTDTIILGGGTYYPEVANQDFFVRSRIVMIGTGAHPDSSLAYNNNGPTEINGGGYVELVLEPGATGSEFHGIKFVNQVGVQYGTGPIETTNVNSVGFFRCEFQDLSLGNGGYGSQASDTYIHECVFRGSLNLSRSLNPIIRNSALVGIYDVIDGGNTLFENCLFFNWGPVNGSGVQYEHNVFIRNANTNLNCNEQSTFIDNIFVGNGAGYTVTFGGGVVAQGNVIRYPLSGTGPLAAFPSTSVTDYNQFDYLSDYHLNPNMPSNVQNAGLYGGGDPWKNGSIPFNPHWRELTTPTGTENGTLQGVMIKASAQQD